jgi:FixJ family two-component response regulator
MDAIVYIVDDDPAAQKLLGDLAESVNLEARCFASAQMFLERFVPDQPACLILDVRMPGMTGIQLMETMRDKELSIPTIVATAYGDLQAAVAAMKLGAIDFLEKPLNMTVLLDLINTAIDTDRIHRLDRIRQDQTNVGLNQLTTRENEILERVLTGRTSKAIAAELGISLKTVEAHRAKIRTKMQVDNVIELIYRVIDSRDRHGNRRIL